MAERASIFETIQIGAEVTPGTAVAALKKLQAIGITMSPKGNISQFRPAGNKFNTLSQMGKEWTEGKADGGAAYNDLAYILASVMDNPTPTVITSTGYTWTFGVGSTSPDSVATYTIEQGSKLRAHRIAHGMFTGMSMDFSRESIKVSANLIGRAIEDDVAMSGNAVYTLTANVTPPTAGTFTLTKGGQTTSGISFDATPAAVQAALEALSTIGTGNVKVYLQSGMSGTLAVSNNVYKVEFVGSLAAQAVTLTGTFSSLTASGSIAIASATTGVAVTSVTPVPVQPSKLDVYMDTSSANLGNTKLNRLLKGSFELTGRFQPLWVVNSSNASFQTWVEVEPTAKVNLTLEADAEGMALLSTMRAGTTKFVRVKATGDIIESATPYTMQFDFALQIGDMIDLSDQDGVYAVQVPMTMVHDATWGKAVAAQLKNTLSAL